MHKEEKNSGFNRRALLSGAAALAGVAAIPADAQQPAARAKITAETPQAVTAASNYTGPVRVATPADLVIETAYGKVRGLVRNGIYTFKGIPYGDTTEGANRFRAPQKPKPWAGVFNAIGYGSVCPQGVNAQWKQPAWLLLHNWDNGITGEDCLKLNVWTPGYKGAKKRPVMLWLHGGGWSGGSSQELPAYDGENIARRGDIVLVSVNHRLNMFGFTNLEEIGGERYAGSGNAGLLDLIAALQWVRENISQFGGDPGNVTIFGQSGGGSKVCHLMAAPAAKGLVHKGIAQSGPGMKSGDVAPTLRAASAFIAELGLTRDTLDKLAGFTYAELQLAQQRAAAKMRAQGGGGMMGMGGGPILDGKVLTAHPFDPVANPLAADIPMLVGANTHEMAIASIGNPELENMPFEQAKQNLAKTFGDRTDRIIEAFRSMYPKANAIDIQTRVQNWNNGMQGNSLKLAQIKAAQPAPVYHYSFGFCTPVLDGRPRAFHCAELPFVFDNIDRAAGATGGGPEARALAAKMSQAWISFARNGNPWHAGLPKWPALKSGQNNTMQFDVNCTFSADPDAAGRKAMEKA